MKHFLLITFLVTSSFLSIASTKKVSMCLDDTLASRWLKETRIIQSDLEVRGIEFRYSIASGSHERQVIQAKKYIDKGIDVLILVPVDGYKAKEIVEYAHNHNTKVIAYSRLIQNVDLEYYMGFNVEEIGKIQAQYLLNNTSVKNLVILNGPTLDYNSELIKKGQYSILTPAIKKGIINIVIEKELHEWSNLEAFVTTEDLLEGNHNKIDAILTSSDMIAESVVDAFKIHDLDVLITGSDAEPSALYRIQNGNQLMTLYLDGALLAHQTADLVFLNMLTHNEANLTFEEIKFNNYTIVSHLLSPIIIDKNNVSQIAQLLHINLNKK